MDKHIIEINLGTEFNSKLKTEVIPLDYFTLQNIIDFIDEDTNYIVTEHLIKLWTIFKIPLYKFKITIYKKKTIFITSAQVKKVQNIVNPFKTTIQTTMDIYNSNIHISQHISSKIEMCEFLVIYKGKEEHNLLPFSYQDFLKEKSDQLELDRKTEMEQWRIEDEYRKEEEESLKLLKTKELERQQSKEKEIKEYNKLRLLFYKQNIDNKHNKHCLFYVHPIKQCNMEDKGKVCGFLHEMPSIDLLNMKHKKGRNSK